MTRRGVEFFNLPDDAADVDFVEDEQVVFLQAQPFRPKFDLVDALFAGDVQNGAMLSGQQGRNLQQECAFAHAGVAANQGERAGHNAAAHHPIKFFQWQADAVQLFHRHGRKGLGLGTGDHAAGGPVRRFSGLWFSDGFNQRVPFAAFTAPAHPFGVAGATLLTDVGGFWFRHSRWIITDAGQKSSTDVRFWPTKKACSARNMPFDAHTMVQITASGSGSSVDWRLMTLIVTFSSL